MLSVGLSANTLADYPNVAEALNDDTLTLYNYWGCLDEGYDLEETHVQAVHYLVPPQGEHLMATVTLKMVRYDFFETKVVLIKINVHDDGYGMLTCEDMIVERTSEEELEASN